MTRAIPSPALGQNLPTGPRSLWRNLQKTVNPISERA
jgi:hypothetical protein